MTISHCDFKKYIAKNSEEFRYLSCGSEGDIYYFKLNKKLVINTKILKINKYVLKIFDHCLSISQINNLIKLSKFGLIPKIFIITNYHIIMKYIDGDTYYNFKKNFPEQINLINDKINHLVNIWNKLGFEHKDLQDCNIIISKNNSVYFIDPKI